MSDDERWQAAWRALGVSPPAGLREALAARYEEPHRAYHTLAHIHACFASLDGAVHLAERPAELTLALWFHDAIYDPRSATNEEQSARWAAAAMRNAGVADAAVTRVERLVLATRHDAVPRDSDAKLLVDVDLAILGAEEARFAEYERQIRREHACVPAADYREGRSRVLTAFLERPRIYGTDWFADRLEERARQNLARSLRALRQAR